MKQNIGFNQFCDAFSDTYKNNFTYNGKRALFDYLEEMEADTGTEIELDPIALCCEYSEYDSAWEAMQQYRTKEDMPSDMLDDTEQEAHALEWLRDQTQVIEVEGGGVIILQF